MLLSSEKVGGRKINSKKTLSAKQMLSLAAAAGTALSLFGGSVRAASTDTWAGSSGSTDWATTGNWSYSSGSGPVASGDSLVFTSANASTGTALTDSLTTNSFGIAGITFNSGALAYTMAGNAFELTGNMTNNSSSLETINNAITLSANQSINAAAGAIAIGGVISGSTFGITAPGASTVTLSGANLYGGTTTIGGAGSSTANSVIPNASMGSAATVKLDFSATGAPASNILAANSTLDLNGGTLAIQGSNSANVVQQTGSTNFESGLSTINLTAGSGGNNVTLNLGQLKINSANSNYAGLVNFTGLSGTNTVSILNVNNASGIVSAANDAGLTINSTDWGTSTSTSLTNQTFTTGTNLVTGSQTTGSQVAITASAPTGLSTNTTYYVVNGNGSTYQLALTPGGTPLSFSTTTMTTTVVTEGTLTAYSGYTSNSSSTLGTNANVNVVTNTTVTGSTGLSANTLRFNANSPMTITMGTGTLDFNTSTNNGGGILVTNTVGSNNVTITGGFLKIPSNRGAAFFNYDTSGAATGNGLIINSVIEDINNGAGVAIAGGGLFTFGGANTYSAPTYVSDSTLSISSNANLGGVYIPSGGNTTLVSTVAPLNLDGSVLQTTATMTLDGTAAAGAGNSLLRPVGVGAQGATFSTGTNNLTINGLVSGAGTLTKGLATGTETGTLTLGGANLLTGATVINGGTLAVAAAAAPSAQAVSALGMSTSFTFMSGTTAGTSIVVGSTTGVVAGQLVIGNGIPTGTTVASVIDTTHLTLSAATTAGNASNYYIYKNAPTTVTAFTAGATTVTVGSAANALVGEVITGTGIAPGTIITGIASNVLTLSQATTGASSATTSYVFGGANQLTVASTTNLAGGQTIAAASGMSGTITGINTTGNVVTLSAANTTIASGITAATFGSAWQSLGTGAVKIANVANTSLNMSAATGTTTIASLSGGGSNGGNLVLGTAASMLSTGSDNTSTTFGGVISGNGSLTKTGTGTFSLTGSNSFTGALTIGSGTVVLGTGGGISGSNSLTLGGGANSGILQLGDSNGAVNATVTSLTTSGTGTANAVVGGNSANSILTINTSSPISYGGVLGGSGTNQNNLALALNGAGTLSLSSSNSYAGGTMLNAGGVTISNSNALGTGTLTLNAATAQTVIATVNGFTNLPNAIAVNGAGTNEVVGTSALTGQVNGLSGGVTLSSANFLYTQTGNGGLRFQTTGITGTGNIEFDNNTTTNTNAGIDIRAAINNVGTLTFGGTGNSVTNTSVLSRINATGGSIGANVTGIIQNSLANLDFSGTTASGSTATVAVDQGTVFLNNTAALQVGNVVSVASGATLDVRQSNTIAGLNNVSGSGGTITNSNTSNTTLTNGGAGSYTFAGTVTDGGTNKLGLTLLGNGSQILSGASTYSGGTLLSAGTLYLNNGSSGTSTSSAIGTGALTIDGGTIDSTVSGITLGTNNAITIGANFAFGGTNSLNLGTGAVTGSTARTITLGASNSTTLTLGGTWTNSTDAANTLTANGAGNTLSIGVLALDGSGSTARTQTIAGSGNVTIGQITNGASAGAQALTYAGTGTLTVNGSLASTYSGALAVDSGTLLINESNITGNANLLPSTGTPGTLTLAGGTVSVTGGSQTFASLATGYFGGLTAPASGSLTFTATPGAAGSTLVVNTSAGGANGATVGGGPVLWGTATSGTLVGVLVTDAGGTGFASVNASHDVIRFGGSSASLLPDSVTASTTDYLVDNHTGATTDPGSSSLTLVGTDTTNSVFINTTTNGGTLTLGTYQLITKNIGIIGSNAETISGSGAGGLNGSGGANLNITNTDTAAVSLNTPIIASGSSAVFYSGSSNSSITFAGSSTYTGGTTLAGGLVKLGFTQSGTTAGALGAGNGLLTMAGGTTLDLSGLNLGVGSVTTSGSSVGTILNNSGSGTSVLTIGDGNSTTQFNAKVADNTTGTGTVMLVKTGTGTMYFGNTVANGAVANTYSGGTLIDAGVLTLANSTIGTTEFGTGPITFNGGGIATQSVGDTNQTFTQNFVVNAVSGNTFNDGNNGNTYTLGTTSSTFTGTGSLAFTTSSFGNRNTIIGANLTGFQGTFDISDDLNTAGHTYSINNSTSVDGSGRLGLPSAQVILDGPASGTLAFQYTGSTTGSPTISIGDLTSTGGIGAGSNVTSAGVLRNATAGTITWSIGALGASDTFAGTIATNGTALSAVTKVGSGAWTLTGNNTYTAGTTVSAGTLFANNATSSLGTGIVNVNGGLLAGSGTINNGASPLTVNNGGKIGAGANASTNGTLSTGAQSWTGGGTYAWKISGSGVGGVAPGTGASGTLGGAPGPGNGNDEGTNWDLLNITSNGLNLSTLTSGSPFIIAPAGTIAGGGQTYSWVIAQSAGLNSIALPVGSSVGTDLTGTSGSGIFAISTAGLTDTSNPGLSSSAFTLEAVNFGSTEDLVLDYNGYSAAPEPGTVILVLAGALPMLTARRRRKRVANAN
jgi:fibronectin-binding autotransporter adhesin